MKAARFRAMVPAVSIVHVVTVLGLVMYMPVIIKAK